MARSRIGKEASKTLVVRIPGEWWGELERMADAKNPIRELVREAVKRFIGAAGGGVAVESRCPTCGGKHEAGIKNCPGPKAFVEGTAVQVKSGKTCKHGERKGYNCWQCGGLAVIE